MKRFHDKNLDEGWHLKYGMEVALKCNNDVRVWQGVGRQVHNPVIRGLYEFLLLKKGD